MLPIEIQTQIDLSAQHHAREVAEGFAKARASLRADRPEVGSNLHRLLFNAALSPWNVQQMLDARPGQIIPLSPDQYQNMAWNGAYGGLASGFWGSLFGPGY